MHDEKTVGITGASGALGKELTKIFREKGFKVIGFTHSKKNSEILNDMPFHSNLEIINDVGHFHPLESPLEVNHIIIKNL